MSDSKQKNYASIAPDIEQLAKLCTAEVIPQELYTEYKVNRGLRDLNGKGVLAGLTQISEVHARKMVNGVEEPDNGSLFYRGIDVKSLVQGFLTENRHGFEEATYLLLFGNLPNAAELANFKGILAQNRTLPSKFVRDIIMKAPSKDMMNTLARSVLTLYYYDENPDDISIPNVLRQSIQLISLFPLLAVYGYQAYNHYENNESLFIHQPKPELSTAENILRLLRPDTNYTPLEASILDLALVLHAEHGGGNNSSFTVHVVSSSATDTYSAIAAGLGSLKGPKHGGANIRVTSMFEDMKKHLTDWKDDDQIKDYLSKLLNKQAFDKSGLIYGIGHAIYSVSDPRAEIFESFVKDLSKEKGKEDEYELYNSVARLAPELISEKRHMYKGVSPNIDFYSGFVYEMLGLPTELFTPIFAISRISGWSAHRIEELVNGNKIIRPAYKHVHERQSYVPLSERK